VPRILTPLGFLVSDVRDPAEPGWLVTVPTFRVDVTREVDLIEEVGRHIGFDTLPTTFPGSPRRRSRPIRASAGTAACARSSWVPASRNP
jgi:phenylalanyl-tRNA synthetase beta subunit